MRDLWRWMAKNRLLAKVLFGIFLCGIYSLLLCWLGAPLWGIILLDLFLIFVNHAYVDAVGGRLLKEPLRIRDECCDPEPMLLETREQLTYRCPERLRQVIRIDHACALQDLGEFEQAVVILEGIHIDNYPSTLPVVKVVYYNNLSDALSHLGRHEEAETWYQKAMEIYHDMPDNKIKRQISHIVHAAGAEAWYRRGEYDRAIACLNAWERKDLRSRVEAALLYARCDIALGRPEQAREKLNFVIQWGNKLFAASHAKELLEQLG